MGDVGQSVDVGNLTARAAGLARATVLRLSSLHAVPRPGAAPAGIRPWTEILVPPLRVLKHEGVPPAPAHVIA